MLYTSYFAKDMALKMNGIVEVSISRSVPNFFNGLSYTKLAPSWDILKAYKETEDWEAYTIEFNKMLDKLDPNQVYSEIVKLVEENTGHVGQDIALICYERSGSNCHRNLVASWFNKNGIKCKEWFN